MKKKSKKKEQKQVSQGKPTRSARNTGGRKSEGVNFAVQRRLCNWLISTLEILEDLDTKDEIYLFYALAATLGDMTTPPSSPKLLKKLKALKTLNTSTLISSNQEYPLKNSISIL